jgi:iron-sulfur cluster assembly accessory protein
MGRPHRAAPATRSSDEDMLTLTPRAAEKVKELIAREGDPALTSLRVAVEGGGCSGFQYALGFDGAPEADDVVADLHGVRVLVDRFSLPYLQGADVDYVDGLMGAGFQISNPNVVQSCGCGSSFQAREDAEAKEPPPADDGCGEGCGCAHS